MPLVSFVLLTFEQRRFVGEAVEAAFAQNYPNLEIVLSDHGSTDGTFEILAGMAAQYRGPHRLRLVRSDSALGVLGHAFEAIVASNGRLVVGASGDDVSRPDRVSRLVRRWRETRAAVLWSDAERVDESGQAMPPSRARGMSHDIARYFPAGGVRHILGAAAAYDRDALAGLPRPDFPVSSEDFYLSLMIAMRGGRFEYLEEPLVRRRMHDRSLSASGGTGPSLAARERAVAAYSAQAGRVLRFADAFARTGGCAVPVDRRRLRADLRYHEVRARWRDVGIAARLASLRHVRAAAQLRWMAPRLFGERVLGLLQGAR